MHGAFNRLGLALISSLLVVSIILAYDITQDRVQYVVITSHLDTQWQWTFDESANNFIPATFRDNMMMLDKYPEYIFNWESPYHYMIMKSKFPSDYERVKPYVSSGKWRLAGGMLVACDVNLPCPESLVRQFLYGNGFFESEFGKRATDMLMPDCFGFGMALPSIGAHCGMSGFSTQKIYCPWLPAPSGAYPKPFDVGMWKGVDGNGVMAAIDPGSYVGGWGINEGQIDQLYSTSGISAAYGYMGNGDQGGACCCNHRGCDENNVLDLINRIHNNTTERTKVIIASSDQLFKDIAAKNLVSKLVVYQGELLAREHGTGTYIARAEMKLKNRRNEQLACAAEAISTAAAWRGVQQYPADSLRNSWIRFLWHQFHDDITGTSTDDVYNKFSLPDENAAIDAFTRMVRDGVLALSADFSTRTQGTPVVVYNALARDREDLVSVEIPSNGSGSYARVYDASGAEAPAQVTASSGSSMTVLFAASVPSMGCAVYDVRQSAAPCSLATAMSITATGLSNERCQVSIDANGDISAVYDKKLGRQLLSAPLRLLMFDDTPDRYPAWEIWYKFLSSPRTAVGGSFTPVIVEHGPARVTLRIERQAEGSTFTQDISLGSGAAGERLEIATAVKWHTNATLLKMAFPLAASNTKAIYDLGLGTIERPSNTDMLYEVPAQQWAGITDKSGQFGAAILNDCKYGWDKPSDNTLRLTIIHSPPDDWGYTGDRGDFHKFTVALYGHANDWRQGGVIDQAARLNQPLSALVVPKHDGVLGTSFSFLKTAGAGYAVMACKQAEKSTKLVVRIRETDGKAASGAKITFPAKVLSVTEANGMEDVQSGGTTRADGSDVVFDIGSYGLKTLLVELDKNPITGIRAQGSQPVMAVRTARIRIGKQGIAFTAPLDQRIGEVTVTDMRGKVVFERKISNGNTINADQFTAELNSLSRGAYAISVSAGGSRMQRIVTLLDRQRR
jgi:alpha-mannosidase